jgi:hypothetical protein
MITKNLYDKLQKANGSFASWAIWEPQGERPKSNMGSQNIFNFEYNPTILESLRNDVVMVGLNFPRELNNPHPFSNFHDESPYANDFKIRYAFSETPYWGAYMTDVLKNLVIPDAQSVRDYIKNNPRDIEMHIKAFEKEIVDLETNKPLLLSFGRDAFGLLKRHLDKDLYCALIPLPHYSHQVRKEKYREEVHSRIAEVLHNLE